MQEAQRSEQKSVDQDAFNIGKARSDIAAKIVAESLNSLRTTETLCWTAITAGAAGFYFAFGRLLDTVSKLNGINDSATFLRAQNEAMVIFLLSMIIIFMILAAMVRHIKLRAVRELRSIEYNSRTLSDFLGVDWEEFLLATFAYYFVRDTKSSEIKFRVEPQTTIMIIIWVTIAVLVLSMLSLNRTIVRMFYPAILRILGGGS